MSRHTNPRVYVGPRTNEIIIPLGRSYGVDLAEPLGPLVITFEKRSVSSPVPSVWTSYAVVNGRAHFEIPILFKSDATDYPKGFYDGVVTIDECQIGCVELIKAPGRYISSATTIEDKCHSEDEWVEPDCANEIEDNTVVCGCSCNGVTTNYCNCIYNVKSNCPTCYNQVIVAEAALLTYAGLDEIDPETCPLPEGSDVTPSCEEDTGACVVVPKPKDQISSVQESNFPEGYVEDVSDC